MKINKKYIGMAIIGLMISFIAASLMGLPVGVGIGISSGIMSLIILVGFWR